MSTYPERIAQDTEREIKRLLDAILDDPSDIGLDPALLQTANPNPQAQSPSINTETGEAYKESYIAKNGVYLEVQRTIAHDKTRFKNPLVTTRHLIVEPDKTTRSEIWMEDDKVIQAASLDYLHSTSDMRVTSQETAEDALAALQLSIEALSAS